MKKIIFILATAFTVLCFITNVYAEFVYEDSDSGAKFTVPDGWSQENFTKERYSIDAKFALNENKANTIIYGSADYWDMLPDSEKDGYSRSDINSSMFSEKDISEMLGEDFEKISTQMINGRKYYKTSSVSTVPIYGQNVDIPTTCIMLIENGWIYTYLFYGEDKYYTDFESLIKSVTYASEPVDYSSKLSPSPITNTSSTYPNTYDPHPNSIFWGFILFMVLMIILILPILIYRFLIKKEAIHRSKAKKISIIYTAISTSLAVAICSALKLRLSMGVIWMLALAFASYKILSKENTSNELEQIDDIQTPEDTVRFNLDNVTPLNTKSTTIIFSHKCTKCGNVFRAKYTLESNRTTIPKLTVICGNCGKKENATDEEIDAAEII